MTARAHASSPPQLAGSVQPKSRRESKVPQSTSPRLRAPATRTPRCRSASGGSEAVLLSEASVPATAMPVLLMAAESSRSSCACLRSRAPPMPCSSSGHRGSTDCGRNSPVPSASPPPWQEQQPSRAWSAWAPAVPPAAQRHHGCASCASWAAWRRRPSEIETKSGAGGSDAEERMAAR